MDMLAAPTLTEILVPQAPLAEAVLRAVLVYAAVVALVRTFGRRGLAEMNTFDIIVTLLLAELIGDAAGADDSVTGAALGAVTLLTMNVGLNRLVHRSEAASRVLQGRPVTVIEDGTMSQHGLRKLHITRSELEHVVRSQHGDDISEVGHAELTPSGKLVLTLKPEEQSATKADVAALTEQLQELRRMLAAGS